MKKQNKYIIELLEGDSFYPVYIRGLSFFTTRLHGTHLNLIHALLWVIAFKLSGYKCRLSPPILILKSRTVNDELLFIAFFLIGYLMSSLLILIFTFFIIKILCS